MSEVFDYDDDDDEFQQEIKTCTHCGEGNLHWENYGAGWKLYDEHDDRHLCQAVEPNADDFDLL